jgi:mannose-6-phosphate isomerase-like protein (cupin superfamily)
MFGEGNKINGGNMSNREERPWGWYEIIQETETHKVKLIHVNPKSKLSLQSHKHRSEVWTVVSGDLMVRTKAEEGLEDDFTHLEVGNSFEIPVGTIHSAENHDDWPVEFIEVQTGTYFGEDDIIRYEDMYGRVK